MSQTTKNISFRRNRLPKQKALQQLVENPLVAIRELNNRSFYNFLKFFWPEISTEDFKDNWHIRVVCNELEYMAKQVAEGNRKPHDLIVNIPPGSTKTIVSSIMFPVWCWTRWYWMKFICVSYSATLALETATTSRDLIRSDRFMAVYPELDVKQDKDQKSNFQVVKREPSSPGRQDRLHRGGNRYSTSVGGTVTGFHGHMILIDDPINPEQAVSEAELRSANRYIDQTLPTRKIDKAVCPTVTIMQRLREDDPTGHALQKNKDNIRHLSFPGEIKNYEKALSPKGYKKYYTKDGLFDPDRLGWKELEELEADLGQYGYAGQIGQSPTPPAGGMFKPDHIQLLQQLPPLPDIYETVRYWDKAGSEGKGAYTVGVKMCKIKGDKYLITDVKRGQWTSEERERIIKETAEADGKDVVQYVEQEGGSGGKESAESTIRNLAGFTVRTDRPTGDKVYRADPFSVQVNNGNVLMLTADWNKDFKDELRFFPHGKYKDQVDASSGAFAKLVSARRAGPLGANRRR